MYYAIAQRCTYRGGLRTRGIAHATGKTPSQGEPAGLKGPRAHLGGGKCSKSSKNSSCEATSSTYGAFLNTVINFLVLAFVIFQVVRTANRFKRPEAPAPVTTKQCPHCTMSIPTKAKRCPHCTSQL